jgi:hypothetical protein
MDLAGTSALDSGTHRKIAKTRIATPNEVLFIPKLLQLCGFEL